MTKAQTCALAAFLALAAAQTSSAEDRAINGAGNNIVRPNQGAANQPFIRFFYRPQFFGNDGGLPTETQRANARTVSNTVSAQSSSRPSARNLSNYIWAWGQFLTHDTDLSTTSNGAAVNGSAPISINDPLDPLGPNLIPFTRANFVPLLGRTPINEVTSYIDASNVYGSDAIRAAALRTDGGTGAKLQMSAGNLLPFNTTGLPNENNGPVPGNQLFVAGDIRANENSLLTSLHTVFAREHNRLVDVIAAQQPALNPEQQYQLARKIVGAEMQAITYREFLPALVGIGSTVPRAEQYQYVQGLDASITTAHSHAAFRFGHSAVTSQLERVATDGTPTGSLGIRDIFFNPHLISGNPQIINELLNGAAQQRSEEIDTLVVDDLRNFLFGPPGAGGLDLASLNIQRGRDAGLPNFTLLRAEYGSALAGQPPAFSQITSDPALAQALESLYTNINNIDAWVGGLAENHVPGASVGLLFKSVIESQFRRLRDGDRLFYRSNTAGLYTDGTLNPEIASIIDLDHVRLSDILLANTDLTALQQNVFFIPGTADYNADGIVNAADYTLWRDTMGATGSGLAADGDRNGVVNIEDYNLWKMLFGSLYPSAIGVGSTGFASATANVPEPTTIIPALLALHIAPRRKRSLEGSITGLATP